ncbi:hypothetical protein BDD12DRAFT_855891 [Trichophaea hybrida]|nr:hypothetical protein BDD12DRAFT_855891 [Trichophaea hybrida]
MTTTSQSRAEPTSVCNNAREGLHETRDRLLKEAGADLELLQKLNTLFCPGRAIRETLTETVVKNILGCICEDCKVTAGYLPEDCRPEIGTCVDIITRDHELAGSAGRLFALLLSIGRPRLILSFIFRKKDDAILREDDLQDTTLETNYWPGVRTGKVHATSDAIARTIVNDFQNNRYQFSPLVLDVKDYITLDKREVLPIIPLRVILGGLRGSVIAFKLYPDYQTLVPDKNAHFARKQIEIEYSELTEADRRTAAEAERDNLDKVSRLEHPHIIDVLKTYRHGSMLNFVFPLAKGNLWEFLRGQKDFEKPLTHTVSPNPGSASSAKNLLESKIWEDMIGIADALHHILTECKDDSYSYLGRHCDLKPANILVHNGTLKITDFGQAQFKIKTDRGSSRITGHSGDQTYLPPEYELGKFPIVYDVWSLGCILLEVLVYALEGPPGVRQLDKLRIENCNTNYFYEHDSDDGGKLRQKSGVREKIHGLKQRASKFRNSQEESFIYNTIDTVNSTIETDFKVRLEADKVRDKLRTDLYIARHATVPRPATPEPPKGQLLVQSFPDVMTAHDGHQRERGKSIIHFYESVEPVPEFRMLVCPETSFPRPLDCKRRLMFMLFVDLIAPAEITNPQGSRTDLNLRFIPDYAFKGKAQNDDTQSENLEVEYCISFERTIRLSVYFATIEQARQFQKCLIQQEILVRQDNRTTPTPF